ncbi:MAG: cytochrome B [Bdellovibrionaceae bacterium]|nr:cytochrome B [Pseudobdellovibrionaceae bacterium]|tara:strand:- start:76394 stop:77017 length:624 start_codon:yes stop_codon:yes gene_type:complete
MEKAKEMGMSRWNPIRQLRLLYLWTMKWAEHPKAEPALGIFSMIEGIFFPIPIDPFLLAMSAGKPKRSLRFAAIASIGSVIGGTIGYYVGYLFWDHLKEFFFTYFFPAEKFDAVALKFQTDAFLAVFLASFTPIPYKVFAVAGGVFQINIWTFVTASIVGRSLRFFVIGFLFYYWGAPIRDYIERHFDRLTIALGVICVALFVIYRL